VLGNQVAVTLVEQAHDRDVVLELDTVEAPVVQGDCGHRDGVDDVGLARAARAKRRARAARFARASIRHGGSRYSGEDAEHGLDQAERASPYRRWELRISF
jgi:hypothetical protein